MPRKKLISDEAVLAAAELVMMQLGPAKLTLQGVGRASGIAAATLVQRFGSKRGMMREVAQARAPRVEAKFAAAAAGGKAPLQALRAALLELGAEFQTPGEAANYLAYLQVELGEEEFRGWTGKYFEQMERGVMRLLWEAVKAGQVEEVTGAKLARAMVAAYWGTVLYWSVMQTGELKDLIGQQMDMLLAPFERS